MSAVPGSATTARAVRCSSVAIAQAKPAALTSKEPNATPTALMAAFTPAVSDSFVSSHAANARSSAPRVRGLASSAGECLATNWPAASSCAVIQVRSRSVSSWYSGDTIVPPRRAQSSRPAGLACARQSTEPKPKHGRIHHQETSEGDGATACCLWLSCHLYALDSRPLNSPASSGAAAPLTCKQACRTPQTRTLRFSQAALHTPRPPAANGRCPRRWRATSSG